MISKELQRRLVGLGAVYNNTHLWFELENATTGRIERFEPQTMEELDRLLPRMCGNLIFDSEHKKNRYLDVAYLL